MGAFISDYSTLDVEFTAELKFTQRPSPVYLCNRFFCIVQKYNLLHIVNCKSFVFLINKAVCPFVSLYF